MRRVWRFLFLNQIIVIWRQGHGSLGHIVVSVVEHLKAVENFPVVIQNCEQAFVLVSSW